MAKKDILNVSIKNPAFIVEYNKKMRNLITKYYDDIKEIIDKKYYADPAKLDFVAIFQEVAKTNSKLKSELAALPDAFFNKRLKSIGFNLEKSIKQAVVKQAEKAKTYTTAAGEKKMAVIPALKFTATREERAFMRAAAEQNASLIKSIGEDSINRASNAIASSIQRGGSRAELFEDLAKGYGITKRRAALIAIDQGNKITEQLAIHKMQSAGIKQGVWIHSHGDKVPRKTHLRFDGKVFDLDKGLYDSQVGRYVKPGELINCYHEDTEVYTENGFVLLKDVKIGEKVLTLNPITKNLSWEKCIAKQSKFSNKIARVKGIRFSAAVDPEHRFFAYKKVCHTNNSTYEPKFIDGVKNLNTKYKFYNSSHWVGEDIEFVDINGLIIPINDYLIFMGYYLSEGSFDNRKYHNRIDISQYKYKDLMFDKLSFFNPHLVQKGINIYSKQLKQYCQQFGKSYEKFIPDIIKALPAEKIRIFLDAFALGDGSIKRYIERNDKYSGFIYNRYYSSSKRMADDLVELIIKTGMGVSTDFQKRKGKVVKFKNGEYETKTDMYSVFEKRTVFMGMESINVKIDDYNKIVYDITVEKNHTLLIRYEGKIHWNGNCTCTFSPVVPKEWLI